MVPPPDTPDFDSMSFEEQMAWLESLAKRQGVDDQELTTSADVEIAEVAADTVIDEPGYTPFEGSRTARRMKEEAEAAAQAPPPEPEPEPEPEPAVLPDLDWGTPEEGVEDMADLFGAMAAATESEDPMQWLGGLSAEPEADIGELEDLFAEAESVWEDSMAVAPPDIPEAAAMPPAPPESVPVEPAPAMDAAASDDDPLGGMDPMLFLESLARRQGANLNELLTAADLDVAEVAADAVVDEPGYTPFEGSRSARRMKEEAEIAAQAPPPEPELAAPVVEQQEAAFEGSESLEWLESLGKRQGAEDEEFLTEAAFDIPELPVDTGVDEPGYTEYDPLSILPSDQPTELPSDMLAAEDEDVGMFEFESGDDSLSWLEDLAAEPDEEFADMFADLEEPEPEPPVSELASASPVPSSDDPLAGLTDEDVARLQAQGKLTGQQELAWLKRQAAKLAAVHHDVEELEIRDEDLAPAEPGDLPPWLEQMRDETEAEGAAILAESLAEAHEVELPTGLFAEIEADVDLDVSSLALDTDELSPAEVDSLWAEESVEESSESEESLESELAAFLEGDLEPEADPLAEALDAEYERKAVGDDTEPTWYTDAVARVASEAPAVPEDSASAEPSAMPEVPAEPVVSAAVPVDMPDWLKEVQQDDMPAAVADMPDWLGGEAKVEPAVAGDIPDWLQDQMPAAEPASDVPDWLSEVGEESGLDWVPDEIATEAVPEPEPVAEIIPEPEPEVVEAAAPASAPAVTVEQEVSLPTPAAVPPGAQFAQYRQRLEANPDDHASRLGLARALRDQQQTIPSLDQYETLINASQHLQDVVNDLRKLVASVSEPRANRLLGDAYMRQGRLQEALDAYRSALNKL